MTKNIIIYSGIQLGKKGTGYFLSFFVDRLHKNNIDFQLIAYKTPSVGFLISIGKKLGIITIARSIYFSWVRKLYLNKGIKDSTVIIFHPQSIGLSITADLIRNNKVFIYVLDTFFFCRKSYNYLEGSTACFKCITNKNAAKENNCKFFLTNQKDEEYYNFQTIIGENLDTICFLTQNDNQTLLLKEKFGDSINAFVLGMLINFEDNCLDKNVEVSSYDFVYHNTNLDAKGIFYFLGLAELMPSLRFLMPYDKSEVSSLKDFNSLNNFYLISMSWETGLKSAINNTKIVINPSLWSSPVEGALLKSIKFNGCVAILPIDFSFQKEIPVDTVIHLSFDLVTAKELLMKVLNSENLQNLYKFNSAIWLNEYERSVSVKFDALCSILYKGQLGSISRMK
jgi:hypothetical protein